MNKIERQRYFFNSISEEYITARKDRNHLYYKKLLWSAVLADIWKYAGKGNQRNIDVLDMMCGCAEGEELVKKYISKEYSYTGFDYSERMIQKTREKNPKLNVFVQDVTTYLPEKKYDIVMIIGGLHHVPYLADKVLHIVYESLKPGAVFINFEPTNNNRIYKNVRNVIYQRNHIFDEMTEQAFELKKLNGKYNRSGLKLLRQYHAGLLAYILYYNPDAFPALNIGNKRLVAALQKLDGLFYENLIGQKLSFATFSILKKC